MDGSTARIFHTLASPESTQPSRLPNSLRQLRQGTPSMMISSSLACMAQFPALCILRPAMAASSQPISICGTDESKRSV